MMPVAVNTTWRNDNPATIWNQLAARLGRQPTDAEARAEVRRILAEARDALQWEVERWDEDEARGLTSRALDIAAATIAGAPEGAPFTVMVGALALWVEPVEVDA